jgi:hypothetical protein
MSHPRGTQVMELLISDDYFQEFAKSRPKGRLPFLILFRLRVTATHVATQTI